MAATVELMPMVGFQVNGSKDLVGPRNDRMDLKNVALRGVSIGYMNKDNGELEFSWTRANSSAQIQRSGGFPSDQFDVKIDQFHLNALYMFSDDAVQPFILIGAGATHLAPVTDRSPTTLFSMALGGGVKWLWNDYIGLRLDGRWTPALSPQGTHFFCDNTGDTGCYSTQANSYASHVVPALQSFEFTSGLLLRY